MDPLRKYLTPSVMLGAVAIAIIFLSGTIVVFMATRGEPAPAGLPTASLYIIPAPTETQPAPTTIPLPTPTSTSEVPPPQPPGVIAVGSYVEVTGTGTVGLRLHSSPNLDSNTDFLAGDNEIFKVTDGPRQADDYTWWFLVSPSDENRRGWAVANYIVATAVNP